MDIADKQTIDDDLMDSATPRSLDAEDPDRKKQCILVQNLPPSHADLVDDITYHGRRTLAVAHLYLREASFSRLTGLDDEGQSSKVKNLGQKEPLGHAEKGHDKPGQRLKVIDEPSFIKSDLKREDYNPWANIKKFKVREQKSKVSFLRSRSSSSLVGFHKPNNDRSRPFVSGRKNNGRNFIQENRCKLSQEKGEQLQDRGSARPRLQRAHTQILLNDSLILTEEPQGQRSRRMDKLHKLTRTGSSRWDAKLNSRLRRLNLDTKDSTDEAQSCTEIHTKPWTVRASNVPLSVRCKQQVVESSAAQSSMPDGTTPRNGQKSVTFSDKYTLNNASST